MACFGAIEILGWPLDRVVTAEIWATDTISADLPPMVEFKAEGDAKIRDRWGIAVEHICATEHGHKRTYGDRFYAPYWHTTTTIVKKPDVNGIYGFPTRCKLWCNSQLKVAALNKAKSKNTITYLGIAADEPERIARHISRPNVRLPLVELGWTEADCRDWCRNNGLLSPIYTTAERGGCWFCHNQGIEQLRWLRRNYPDLWALMLKWDKDSPVTFKADGHTVHDYDRRFDMEDKGLVPSNRQFKWPMIDQTALWG